MVAVGRTEAELRTAVDAVGMLIAFYGSTPAYVPVLEVEGWAEVQPELNALSKVGKFAEMRALISDEMVARIGVVGTPEQCAAEIGRRTVRTRATPAATSPLHAAGAQIADLIEALHKTPALP